MVIWRSKEARDNQLPHTQARETAFNIYAASPTQENIRGTEFGMWQAVIEWADYNAKGKNLALRAISGASDNIKTKALELLGV